MQTKHVKLRKHHRKKINSVRCVPTCDQDLFQSSWSSGLLKVNSFRNQLYEGRVEQAYQKPTTMGLGRMTSVDDEHGNAY